MVVKKNVLRHELIRQKQIMVLQEDQIMVLQEDQIMALQEDEQMQVILMEQIVDQQHLMLLREV